MKIVHLFYNLRIGGSETMVIDIMNHQSESEEVYLIIINKENDPQLLQTISPRIKTYIIGRNLGSKNPLPFIRLNRVVSQLNPDVVHIHNHHIIPVLFKRKNTRYFFTAHTNGINILQYNRFDKLFSISKFVAQDIHDRYGIASPVIYNGISTPDIVYEPQPATYTTFRIVQIGRQFVQQKGQDILLKALHLLVHQKKLTGLSLDFIGHGPDTEMLKRLAKELDIQDHVTFLGARSRSFIYQHLHQYQLLVQASRQEGFGLTIAEAMCAGVPVLISDIKGPMEIIDNGKYGTAFEAGNAGSCAEKIAYIMQHYSEYVQKTSSARDFVLRNFDISTTARNYINAYQNT